MICIHFLLFAYTYTYVHTFASSLLCRNQRKICLIIKRHWENKRSLCRVEGGQRTILFRPIPKAELNIFCLGQWTKRSDRNSWLLWKGKWSELNTKLGKQKKRTAIKDKYFDFWILKNWHGWDTHRLMDNWWLKRFLCRLHGKATRAMSSDTL